MKGEIEMVKKRVGFTLLLFVATECTVIRLYHSALVAISDSVVLSAGPWLCPGP